MNFRIVLKKRLESINVDWIESNEFSIIAEKFGHREIQEILLIYIKNNSSIISLFHEK